MTKKRDVLVHLSREELLAAADRLGVELPERRAKEPIVEALTASRKAPLVEVLADLKRDRLKELNTANKQMNLVWQATSRWVRNQLLADQRVWLKKRELECRLNSAEAAPDQQELQRLRCEAQATQQRIPTLRSQIESLEAQQPAEAAEPAAPTTRSARTSPSEAADAAAAVAARQRAEQEATERAARQAQQQMQRNLQSLQKQLENQ